MAPAGVPEIKPVIGWPVLDGKDARKHPSVHDQLAGLVRPILREFRLPNYVGDQPMALIQIGKPPHALLVVGIDRWSRFR